MEIQYFIGDNKSFAEKLYTKYYEEMNRFSELQFMSKTQFESFILNEKEKYEILTICDKDSIAGILLYSVYSENSDVYCKVPLFGYYYENQKTLSRLFEICAEKLSSENPHKTLHFSVHLYAHDIEAQRLFSFLQFGFEAETGIKKIEVTPSKSQNTIKLLCKAEISSQWHEIWELTNGIIEQLKGSPVFYPSTEFTEEVYKEFYLDENTNLFAYIKDEKIIGIIETNSEPIDFITPYEKSVNIGEAYVLPEYRGKINGVSIAENLLYYALGYEKKNGANWAWVEHGTANPTARGFWNKYFHTFDYEMTRTIYPVDRSK